MDLHFELAESLELRLAMCLAFGFTFGLCFAFGGKSAAASMLDLHLVHCLEPEPTLPR